MYCPKCGGSMEGDGYTIVLHCEFADEDKYHGLEPDAKPVCCDYEEETEELQAKKESFLADTPKPAPDAYSEVMEDLEFERNL